MLQFNRDIYYAFNRLDYIVYLFLFLFLFGILRGSSIISIDNLLPFAVTSLIVFYLVNMKVQSSFDKMNNINNLLRTINTTKYPNIAYDIDMVNVISKLDKLKYISRIKYNQILQYVDEFFDLYKKLLNLNYVPTHLYQLAKDVSKDALNVLLTFYIDGESYDELIANREIKANSRIFIDPYINTCIKDMRLIFSKYLTLMEQSINKDWLEGNININSRPIYPDDVEPSIYGDIEYSNRYNIY